MGNLTDLVVEDISKADAIANSACPHVDFEGSDLKGIGLVELATLYEIVAGIDFDSAFEGFAEPIVEVSEDGPWVYKSPDSFTAELSRISTEELDGLVGKWSQTEEMQLMGWSKTEVKSVISEISKSARLAIEDRKELLVWMAL